MLATLVVTAGVAAVVAHRGKLRQVVLAWMPGDERPASTRIAALADELKAGRRDAVDAFWREVAGNAPLVEPIEGDAKHSHVTFVRRGDGDTRAVGLAGLPSPGRTPLVRLADSDVWFRTERLPNDARLGYAFHVNVPDERPSDPVKLDAFMQQFPPLPDPHARTRFEGRSLLEMPAAPAQPWINVRLGVARGAVTQRKFAGGAAPANQERTLTVYTPANYGAGGEPYDLLVAFDGPGLPEDPITLDNLIAAGKIRPLVAVFVHHLDRSAELGCSDAFADLIANELVPWVHKNYHVTRDLRRTTIRGLSLGGLMAAHCALRHPNVFGNVLSQSGSFQWFPEAYGPSGLQSDAEPGWLTRKFVESPKVNVAFYLEVGRFEHFFPYSLLSENRRLRDVLRAKGYPVHYSEFSGNHDPVNWRGSFADGLIALEGERVVK